MKKILYVPFPAERNENHYTSRMIDLLASIENVSVLGLPSRRWDKIKMLASMLLKQNVSLVVLNWHENVLVKNGRMSVLGLLRFFMLYVLYWLAAKKVVYVRHNMYPHGLGGLSAQTAARLTSLMANRSHVKISHSGHLKKDGYVYVPHPLYDLKIDLRSLDEECRERYFVIFGRVERYKKIEKVIDSWPEGSRLVVAGNCDDVSYLRLLIKKSENRDVIVRQEYVPDAEAQELVAKSSGLLLTHADDDMIVSGSFFYAMTLGVPVYAIATPFLKWLQQEYQFEGLCLCTSIEELVRSTRLDLQWPSRKAIRKTSEMLFGDATIVSAWQHVIGPETDQAISN